MKDNNKKIVVIVGYLTALCLIGDSMLYIALPIFWKDIGLHSLWEVGFLLSINRFVRLPFNPIATWFFQKFRMRTILLIAITLTIMINLGYATLNSFSLMILLRIAWGFVWSLLRLGGQITLTQYSNQSNRGYYVGIYNGVYRLGSLIGMVVGGTLTSIIGFQETCIYLSLFSFFGLLWLYFSPNLPVKKEVKVASGFEWAILHNKDIQSILINGILVSFFIQGVFTSNFSYLINKMYGEKLHLFGNFYDSIFIAGFILGIRWLWEPFLAPYIGSLSDSKIGKMPIFLLSLSTLIICFFLLPFHINEHLWILIVLAVLLVSTLLTTITDTLTADVAINSKHPLHVLTLYSISLDIGAAFGPVISFLILDNITIFSPIYFIYWSGSIIFLLRILFNDHPFRKKVSLCRSDF